MLLQMVGFLHLLWMDNIPLCLYSPNFFIHSFINGHLVHFYVLAILSTAAVSMVVQISFQVSVFVSEMELLNLTVILLLIF